MVSPLRHVLLLPEAIQYTETESTPVYGTIVAVAGVDVTVRLLSSPDSAVQVPASTVQHRQVSADEYAAGDLVNGFARLSSASLAVSMQLDK
ncbi:hypothetical protein PI124_g8479 [Phytophthora idaei]|nr:hypothetical protein PI125_g8867 [Phytophthora idaei]KAG3151439.1 hypothetical protein PI126_g11003 [Phytophthora idaei]KAG3246802.1 hypothetical protein PI124_g8479 [Phytophthora idaei]